MGPGWAARYRATVIVSDILCALLAGGLAVVVRFGEVTPYVEPYALSSAALPLLWVVVVGLSRAYEPRFAGVGSEEFRRVARAGVMLTAAVAVVAYVTKIDVARGYVIIALPVMTLLTLLARYALRRRLHHKRTKLQCMRRVIAVGHQGSVADLVRLLQKERYHGMHIVGACLPDDRASSEEVGVPVLGGFSDVPLVVAQAQADTVAVLACPELDGSALRRLAWRLEKSRTDLVVAPALMEVAGPRTTIRPVAGMPLLHVEHPELAGGRRLVKNVFDRVVAGVGLLLVSPLFLLIAAAVRATSSGPAFFRQTRVGKDGRTFTIVKFRTMGVDAESRKIELASDIDGVLFKIKHDPRVTRVGAFLRRHSLDELPQLVNVVKGDMSLVGPRPPLPEEVARYGDDVRRRLLVRPGMTGLWQVSGRSDLSWEEAVRLDLRYMENWSLTLDLQIMWKTWSAVARGSGAY
ncbi:sugar transferase [Herbidospora daliensis]|uniref:sugar transferase n=1 Tax=Herbidospora daliensis TaxID=295585 RepID=UPI00078297C2|nr:sugar transferase [Herbidospora daliensis]